MKNIIFLQTLGNHKLCITDDFVLSILENQTAISYNENDKSFFHEVLTWYKDNWKCSEISKQQFDDFFAEASKNINEINTKITELCMTT